MFFSVFIAAFNENCSVTELFLDNKAYKAIELQLFTVSSSYIRHHYPCCMTERKKNTALFYMKNKYQIKREKKGEGTTTPKIS